MYKLKCAFLVNLMKARGGLVFFAIFAKKFYAANSSLDITAAAWYNVNRKKAERKNVQPLQMIIK